MNYGKARYYQNIFHMSLKNNFRIEENKNIIIGK